MTFRTIACLPALIGAWQHCGGGLLYMTAELHYQALKGEAVGLPELEYPTVRSINMVQPGSI